MTNVLAERADGGRAMVSHFNKAHKGRWRGRSR